MDMEFASKKADIFTPDGVSIESALSRTTHMGIGAHQDDLEIMAFHGILECFRAGKPGFLGVVVSDGAGSPRAGAYASVTDEEMQKIRNKEQQKAASIGKYSASIVLGHPTSSLKDPKNGAAVRDIRALLEAAKPGVVYTHNLADKHDTHVAVALRTIKAIREMSPADRPKKVYGCEVWRGLDWMDDADKSALNVSGADELAASLIRVHDSQVAGGKRYDLATLGRRKANATYFAAHATDEADMLIFAMDLNPLVSGDETAIPAFINRHTEKFSRDVAERLSRLS
jgi:LmbE family N-acetylglucosaminyl deacetylase